MASEITGHDEYAHLLDSIEKRMSDLRPIASRVHKVFVEEMRAGKIPVDTGRLRESLTNPSSNDHIWKESPHELAMGSRDPASVFQAWQVPKVDEGEAVEILRAWVHEGKR